MKTFMVLIALLFFLPLSAAASQEKIAVNNAWQLAQIQEQATLFIETNGARGNLDLLSANFILTSDIALPANWTPIGDSDTNARFVFSGTFDGAGHTISGLNISDTSARSVTSGLFGKIENAEIRNITLENPILHAHGDYGSKEFSAGLLAGEIIGGRIENIRITGGEIIATAPEAGSGAVGGLVGRAISAQFENILVKDINIFFSDNFSDSFADRSDTRRGVPLRAAGGISGSMENCLAKNVLFLNGKINANALSSGGFAGQICGGKFILSGANFVIVEGTDSVGGFTGLAQENAIFEHCHATAQVSGSGIVGGFAGRVNGAVSGQSHLGTEFIHCRAFGFATGEQALAGGFVGRLAGRSRVTFSTAYVNIISNRAGGFVGELTNASRIEFSTSHGAVHGTEAAGGFAAVISSTGAPNTITSSLALGNVVSGGENTFRFAAKPDHDGINGCYSFLGMTVISNGKLSRVIPNPYGKDGGDISLQSLTRIKNVLVYVRIK